MEFADFSEAKKTWAGYESKIEAQAALEARSQPRLRALQAEFEEEQAAHDEGKYRQYNLLAVCISLKLFMVAIASCFRVNRCISSCKGVKVTHAFMYNLYVSVYTTCIRPSLIPNFSPYEWLKT